MICCSPARHGLLPASDFLLLNTYTPRYPASPRKVSTRRASPTLTPARSCLTRRYPSLRTTSADVCTRVRTILTLRCSLHARALVMQDVTTGRTLRQLMFDAAMDAKRKTKRKKAYMHASCFPKRAGYFPQRRVLHPPSSSFPSLVFFLSCPSHRSTSTSQRSLSIPICNLVCTPPLIITLPENPRRMSTLYPLPRSPTPAIHTRSDVVFLTSAPLPPQSHSPCLGLISCHLYSTVV